MREVLRQEKKYLIQQAQGMALNHRLQQVLHQDDHNGAQGYVVRSLYFDTLDDQDLFEKEFGMEIRRKVRLRVYDPRGSFALLELKQKQGDYQRKRSLRLSRQEAQRLIACDYTPLLTRPEPFAAECYALMQTRCYRPKTIVEYRRKAFVVRENNIRLTFDHQIDATASSFALFAPHLALTPVFPRSHGVLEVKFNGFLLSYVKELLGDLEKSQTSVSKYVLARSQTYHPHL